MSKVYNKEELQLRINDILSYLRNIIEDPEGAGVYFSDKLADIFMDVLTGNGDSGINKKFGMVTIVNNTIQFFANEEEYNIYLEDPIKNRDLLLGKVTLPSNTSTTPSIPNPPSIDLSNYVTLNTDQNISGIKNFLSGIKLNNSPIITYDSTTKSWLLEGNLIVTGGGAFRAALGDLDVPTIMDALVVDESFIVDNGVLRLNPNLDLGGLDTVELENYLTANKYATITDISSALKPYITSEIVEKTYSTIKYVDETFVRLAGELQTISARHDFMDGLKIGGLPIYKSQDDTIYLDCNLVVRGGITSRGTNETITPSIFEALPIDGDTIKRTSDGRLYVDADALNISGGGGVADSVSWENVTGKPSWVGSTKPTYTASEVGALGALDNAVSATKLQTPRTIWGKSFDGTSDILGDLTNVGNIYSRGAQNGGYVIYSSIRWDEALSIEVTDANGNWLSNGIAVKTNGNVALGGTTADAKLHVHGDVIVDEGKDLTLKAVANSTDPGDLVFADGNGAEVARIYYADSNGLRLRNLRKGEDGLLITDANLVRYGGVWLAGASLDANAIRDGFRAGKLFAANGVLDGYRGFLEYGYSGYTAQFHSISNNSLFYRWCENGTWLAWREVAFTDSTSLTPSSGTLTITGNILATGATTCRDNFRTNDNYYGFSVKSQGREDSWYGVKTYMQFDEGYTMGVCRIGTSFLHRGLSIGFSTGNPYNYNIPSDYSYTDVVVIRRDGNVSVDGILSFNRGSSKQNFIYLKESGYGDQFSLGTSFGNADDANYLYIASAVGGANTNPELTDKIRILAKSGNVALGGTTASEKLHVHGNILVIGGITQRTTSDRRLKRNIKDFNASEVLMSLGRVQQFEYIESEVKSNHIYQGIHYGLMYQNVVGTALDRMCHEREDGFGSINYHDTSFLSLIAGVCQELIEENKKLKKRVESLERRRYECFG